jgi:hypothetical protein
VTLIHTINALAGALRGRVLVYIMILKMTKKGEHCGLTESWNEFTSLPTMPYLLTGENEQCSKF